MADLGVVFPLTLGPGSSALYTGLAFEVSQVFTSKTSGTEMIGEGIDEGSRVVAVDIVKNEDGRLPRVCGLLPGPGYEVLGGRATRSTLGT